MDEIRFEQKIIVVSLDTISILFDQDNWSDLVTLYMFYHKQCKIQKTNQSWTTSKFTMEWLWWWDKRFKSAKSTLSKLWIIEDIQTRDEKWRVNGHYVRLNFIESHQQANISSGAETQGVDRARPGYCGTNAWSNININAWSNLKWNAYDESEISSYPSTPVVGIPETGTSRIKEKVIPTLSETEAMYGKSELNKIILSIFELQNFYDKVDLKKIWEYYDYILATFKVVYWWGDTELKANKEKVFYHMNDFRKHYQLRPEKDIKKFKGRLLNWIEGSLKFSNQK